MVRVAVRRSGDQLVVEIEAGERVHRRHFERVVQIEIREQAGDTLSEHGLADARRTMEEHVVPPCCGYFAGPLSLDLTDHICQIKTAVGDIEPEALREHLDPDDPVFFDHPTAAWDTELSHDRLWS